MNKIRTLLRSRAATIVLAGLAVALLLSASIGGARAAVSIFSDDYGSEIEMQHIGVTLLENEKDISWRNYSRNPDLEGEWDEYTGELLKDLADVPVQLETKYDERIAVRNSGLIDQYVRVTLYRYWLDEDGNKMHSSSAFSPELIEIEPDNTDVWIEDKEAEEDSKDPERRVFYYSGLLPQGETTVPLTKSITIKSNAGGDVTYNGNGSIAYRYKGKTFVLEAVVDAVQDHNVDSAKTSVWGQNK